MSNRNTNPGNASAGASSSGESNVPHSTSVPWKIELSTEKELRQFDYSTISDVILHVRFTARENGGLFKDNALTYLKSFIMNPDDLPEQPLML